MTAWKPTLTWNKDGTTMTDAKDPLEELKAVEDVYVETCTSCMANRPLIVAAIVAWEKERAAYKGKWWIEVYEEMARLRAMRAAVEKVRDELRKSGDENDQRMADALDAALLGGA